MPHYGEFDLIDYSAEKATMLFHFGAITAVSLPGFITQFGALRNALDSITLGSIAAEKWVGDSTVLDNTPPTNSLAQRELAYLVIYAGEIGGKEYRLQIGTADPSKVIPGTDIIDETDTDIQAFITAFENLVVPKDDPEGVVYVSRILLIGRDY